MLNFTYRRQAAAAKLTPISNPNRATSSASSRLRSGGPFSAVKGSSPLRVVPRLSPGYFSVRGPGGMTVTAGHVTQDPRYNVGPLMSMRDCVFVAFAPREGSAPAPMGYNVR